MGAFIREVSLPDPRHFPEETSHNSRGRGEKPRLEQAQRLKGNSGQDAVLHLRASPPVPGETARPPFLRCCTSMLRPCSDSDVRGRHPPPSADLPSASKFRSPPTVATVPAVNFHLLPSRLAPLLVHLILISPVHQLTVHALMLEFGDPYPTM